MRIFRGLIITVFLIITSFDLFSQDLDKSMEVSGIVKDSVNKEVLPGVMIFVPELNLRTFTNSSGYFTFQSNTKDSILIEIYLFGYKQRSINVSTSSKLNIDLVPLVNTMKEVVVTGNKSPGSDNGHQISTVTIPVEHIQQLPSLFGEKDVLKVLQLMPGVQKGNEGSTGIYVRGGGPDQNLILFEGVPLYNINHLYGFFSLFNGDGIKDVTLTKGGFPARYGGRLSSVVEVNMREGNREKLKGSVGIGLVSARILLEGPVIKNKSSFIFSARRSYLNLLVTPFLPRDRFGSYYFYDLNGKYTHRINDKNTLTIVAYTGKDKLNSKYASNTYDHNTSIFWRNRISLIHWTHLFNNRLSLNTSVIHTKFNTLTSTEGTDKNRAFAWDYNSAIRDVVVKNEFDWNYSPSHQVKFGIHTIIHRFRPGASVFIDSLGKERKDEIAKIDALESALYVEDVIKWHPRLIINPGLRFSYYRVDDKSFWKPEPRISLAYHIREKLVFKTSYAEMNQYVLMLSQSIIGPPLDLWIPATETTKPQTSRQFTAGVSNDFSKDISFTWEAYYKKSHNIVDYKAGATYLNADVRERSWESKITNGKGWSYGTEVLLQKKSGRLSGWIGYTLSWSQMQFDQLNNGEKFFARYDRRHDASVVAIYKLNGRIKLSLAWVLASGNAITMPVAIFQDADPFSWYPKNSGEFNSNELFDYFKTIYSEKNGYRMPFYHRLDVGVQFDKKLKKDRERTWEINIYNLYNRQNPYYYFIVQSSAASSGTYASYKLMQLVLFPIIPSVAYSIKF